MVHALVGFNKVGLCKSPTASEMSCDHFVQRRVKNPLNLRKVHKWRRNLKITPRAANICLYLSLGVSNLKSSAVFVRVL